MPRSTGYITISGNRQRQRGMKRVLVITADDELGLMLLSMAGKGHFEACVKPFSQGLEEVRRWKPHLVILDILDDSDLHLCSEIRNLSLSMPLIIIASYESEKNALRAFRSGAWDYFRKPVDPDILGRAISVALNSGHEKVTREEYLQRLWSAQEGNEEGKTDSYVPFQIKRVIRFMELNLKKAMTLDDMASIAGMSKYHFCRTFKQHLKTSPFSYLHRLRVNAAKEMLLSDPSIPITDVALNSGYSSIVQFERMFRKTVGLSPRQYKNIYSPAIGG